MVLHVPSRFVSSLATAALVVALAGGLSACGRRGALEPPPSLNKTPQQTEQTRSGLPGMQNTGQEKPKSGPVIPDKPFILDPLL